MHQLLLSLHARTRAMITKHLIPNNQDEGASILEYAAVIILVGGIAVAVMQLEVFKEIPTSISTSIQEVLNPNPGE